MEVFTQRLEDEYDASVIVTPPSVPYKLKIKDDVAKSNRYSTTIESGNFITVNNPQDWPLVSDIEEYLEPIVHGNFEIPTYDLILCIKGLYINVLKTHFSFLLRHNHSALRIPIRYNKISFRKQGH